MQDSNCPNQTQLGEYVAGNLALATHQTIDAHLDRCEACQATVETIDEQLESPLSQLLKIDSVGVANETTDRELDDLIQRAKRIEPGGSLAKSAAPPETVPSKIGQVLGGYQLLELIGTGGMGDVYRAKHLRMNREVALKLISDQRLNLPEVRGRFQREVEAAAKLNHPNIVTAFDADEIDGQHFLVMEYVDGQNLSECIKQDGPLPLDLVRDIVLQAAKGLAYAHSRGVIHRDVKPANLLLDQNGIVKVLDMGLATAPLGLGGTGDEKMGSDLTTSQSLMGTAAYMAPEQAADPRGVDQRADIYSLGCTVHYLLTGETMFQGSSIMEMIFQHRDQPAPRLQDRCQECTAQFESSFQRMVAKSADDRYSSFEELVNELETNAGKTSNQLLSTRSGSLTELVAILAVAAAVVGLALWLPTLFRGSDTDLKGKAVSGVPDTDGAGNIQPVDLQKDDPSQRVTKAKVPIEMIPIKPGKFWMGAHPENEHPDDAAKPRHEVTLIQRFELGKFEVTRRQFKQVMGVGAQDQTQKQEDLDLPVSGLSWVEAIQFCNKLSAVNGLAAYYKISKGPEATQVTVAGGDGFRLPTEAEWEYAARAGSETIWDFGDDPQQLEQFAWFAKNAVGVTKPVGTKQPNGFGLFDMYGNVPEWCWDRYDPAYYAKSAAINPTGSTRGFSRVFRGGSVRDSLWQVNSSSRTALAVHYGQLDEVGLRVARNLDR